MEKPKSVNVRLQFPVEHEGATYSDLTFRRMKAGDALVGEDETSQVMAGYKIFAALASVPVGVICALDMEDLTEVATKAASMMGKQALVAIKDLN